MFEKGDSVNSQKMNGCPFSKFYDKFELVFILTQENKRYYFKANRKCIGFSKNSTRDFQNSASFERLACFSVTIPGNFERFQYSNFETNFLKNKNLFQKLPYKTVLSEANVQTKKLGKTKLTYHKERSFASNYLTLI